MSRCKYSVESKLANAEKLKQGNWQLVRTRRRQAERERERVKETDTKREREKKAWY